MCDAFAAHLQIPGYFEAAAEFLSVLGPLFAGFINECSAALLMNVDFRDRVFHYHSVLSPDQFAMIFNTSGMSLRLTRLDYFLEYISDPDLLVPWGVKHSSELCRKVSGMSNEPVTLELIRKAHEEADAAARRFSCPEEGCGYKALKKSGLKQHMSTHTSIRPFSCPEEDCCCAYKLKQELIRHMKNKHSLS